MVVISYQSSFPHFILNDRAGHHPLPSPLPVSGSTFSIFSSPSLARFSCHLFLFSSFLLPDFFPSLGHPSITHNFFFLKFPNDIRSLSPIFCVGFSFFFFSCFYMCIFYLPLLANFSVILFH